MAENTKIQWCHHTFNPWRGCTKVSPGCAHCYAETLSHRNPAVLGEWGDDGHRAIAAESYWRQPLAWNRAAAQAGQRRRVFCLSLGDVFENRPDLDDPRERLFDLILQTPSLDWLLLTKRPTAMAAFLFGGFRRFLKMPMRQLKHSWGDGWQNVWLGVSVENQKLAQERIPYLLSIPAALHWLSCEPLLGELDLRQCFYCRDYRYGGIDWVVVGGESGSQARPCDVGWIRFLVQQCQNTNRAVFVKQFGANIKGLLSDGLDHDKIASALGSTYRMLDPKGGDPSEWPLDLRVREFPAISR